MTKYRVLRQIEAEGPLPMFVLLGSHEAHDGDGAITAAIKGMSDEERAAAPDATYVAIPLRSWTEATPEVQLELKVRVR